MRQIILITTMLITNITFAKAQVDFEKYLLNQKDISTNRLYKNISREDTLPGIVVASPSKAEPNYYFHWVRDAALVMDLVRSQMVEEKNTQEKKRLVKIMFTWVSLVKKLQATPNMSGGVGEPKFNVDGSAYDEPWGRPQNDGPAIRALTLTKFANYLLDNGEKDLVEKVLYSGKFPASSVIKTDLEYVSHSVFNTDFDPWEEVRGFHFYNRMVQRKALHMGSLLAQRLGDHGAAIFYKTQADIVKSALLTHWNGKKRIFEATIGRDAGANYKYSGIDSSVILGVIHSDEDDFIGLDDPRLVSTAHELRESFSRLYPVNKNGAPGTLIGRYPEDIYNGNGVSEGHGWVLTTHALAQYYYRLLLKNQKNGNIKISPLNLNFYQSKLSESKMIDVVIRNGTYNNKSKEFTSLQASLKNSADNLMKRVRYHSPVDGRFSEQIDRHTGFMRGAYDLTWSYASFLTALYHREKLN